MAFLNLILIFVVSRNSLATLVLPAQRPQDVMTDIQIEIADVAGNDGNRSSYIELKQGDCRLEKLTTPQILDDDDHGSFWFSWYNGNLRLGRKGETTPFYDSKVDVNKLHTLKYITFSTNNGQNEVRWRFQQPPVIERPRNIVTVSGGKPRWNHCNYKAKLPNEAIIGGYENEPLYVIRALEPGNCQQATGKFVRSEGLAYIACAGASHVRKEFDVLCGFDYQWVSARDGRVPAHAVESAYVGKSEEIFYVGRAYYDGHLIPGKVYCSHKCIYIPYKNREIGLKTYEVLTEPEEVSGVDW